MTNYRDMSTKELYSLRKQLKDIYKTYQEKHLQLNMSRGNPSTEQLDSNLDILDVLRSSADLSSIDGDIRNYGILTGITEAKELFSNILDVPADQVIIYGESSLTLMFDTISHSYVKGICGNAPWSELDHVKFLCPVPGYDRHFAITEYFGIEMIPIPMKQDGPDMDIVEHYVSTDSSVKGIWCVPKYANPSGITYSPETVRRFAALEPMAQDFRIFWDNAYCVHDLDPSHPDLLLNLAEECEKAGHPDLYYEFASTSKITFPGSGISCMIASAANRSDMEKQMKVQMIGHDKINQLRHVRYLKDVDGIKKQMEKLAAILRPKFSLVQNVLEKEITGTGAGKWSNPHGGYFVCFYAADGCGKRIVSLCKEAGVTLTPAGSTYPYGQDPLDSCIRIAPSYPSITDLKQAMEIFTVCAKLAYVERILGEKSSCEGTNFLLERFAG